ncbi:hypothetical protein [Xanthomonas axonopodis]
MSKIRNFINYAITAVLVTCAIATVVNVLRRGYLAPKPAVAAELAAPKKTDAPSTTGSDGQAGGEQGR